MNALAEELIPRLLLAIPTPRPEVIVQRDRRTTNNMAPEDKATHLILEQWGRETRSALNAYPPVTLLGRLIEQGANGASQAGRPPVSLSEDAARADACVAKLCQIDQRALRFYYQHQEPLEALARHLGMRVRQAQNVLRRARWRFAAHLAVCT
jgi:DNA-directed RNA polymerase specialized sigma24 family protein